MTPEFSNFQSQEIQYKDKEYNSIMHFLVDNTTKEEISKESTIQELTELMDEDKIYSFVVNNYDLIGDMVYEKVQDLELKADKIEYDEFKSNKLNKLFSKMINEVLDDYEDDPNTKINLNNHVIRKIKSSKKKDYPVDHDIVTFTDGNFEEYGVSVLSNFFPYRFTLNGMIFVSPWQYVSHQLATESGKKHTPEITDKQNEKIELFQNRRADKKDSRGWVTSVRKYIKQLDKPKPKDWDEEKHLMDAMRAKFTQNYSDRYSPVKFISILQDTDNKILAQYIKNEKVEKSYYIERYTTGVNEEKTKAGEKYWKGDNLTGALLEDLRSEFTSKIELFTETPEFAAKEEEEESEGEKEEDKITEAERKILEFLSTFYLYLLGNDREKLEALTNSFPQEELPGFARKHDLLTRDFTGGYDYLLYLFRNATSKHQEFLKNRNVPRVLKRYVKKKEEKSLTPPPTTDFSGMDMMFVSVPNFDTTVQRKRPQKEEEDSISKEEIAAASRLQAGNRGLKTFKILTPLPKTQKLDFSIDDRVDPDRDSLSPILSFVKAYEMFNRKQEDFTDPPVYSDILKNVYKSTLDLKY